MAKDIRVVITGESLKLFINGVEVTGDNSSVHKEETETAAYSFDEAVEFLCHGSGKDFLSVVRYCISHNNKFPRLIRELSGAVNADDAYCSAIIRLSRPLGEAVESKVFNLLKAALDCSQLDGEFIKVFESLKIINNL